MRSKEYEEPQTAQADVRGTEGRNQLECGRKHYERRAWADAFDALTLADRAHPLEIDDLERLATSAYLVGREEDYLNALERAHQALLEARQWARAARGAFWIGLCLLFRGKTGPATGWFGRAKRLLDRDGRSCAEHGYLLVPRAERELASSDSQAAYASAAKAVEIGERFADTNLIACARHIQGRALLQQGEVEQGLALLDEAMVAVVAGELSPLMTGLIYCSVIDSCMQVYALVRAREWTFALSRWCEAQPQLVAFTGTCLVHRAEILELHGAWPDAIAEAQRACSGFGPQIEQQPPAAAFYRRGELCRLRGEFAAAEVAYREASQRGCEPQPGLALLRMAQGQKRAAAVAIRRSVNATADRFARARLLPAYVEIMLEAGDVEEARSAFRQLEESADSFDAGALGAMAAYARGSVLLAEGDPAAAVCWLRQASEFWRKAEAPYQVARARELVGLACRALGDEDGAELELEAARSIFDGLGAAPDLGRIASYAKDVSPVHGLTNRELQVLRLVATGKTNKVIASELFVSRRTIDRHVSNLFGKLDVSSRAAATSYAHRHKLV
jgi:ATP/maltotriose-dependent transcriptional regulator MalT